MCLIFPLIFLQEVPVDYLHPGKRKRISRVKNQSSNVNRQKPPKESNSDDGAVKSVGKTFKD